MAMSGDELADPETWSTEDEVHLLQSTLDNKPVGIDKHFRMSIVWDHFTSTSKKNTSSDSIWRKLHSWYNRKNMHEPESMPFELTEENFKLPSEIIPESILKSLTDEERKNVDTSGVDQKYFTVSIVEENNRQSHLELRGHEKLRWFENSLATKTTENAFNNRRINSVDFSAISCETDRLDQKSSCSSVHGYVSSFDESGDNSVEIDLTIEEESNESNSSGDSHELPKKKHRKNESEMGKLAPRYPTRTFLKLNRADPSSYLFS